MCLAGNNKRKRWLDKLMRKSVVFKAVSCYFIVNKNVFIKKEH